MVPGTIFVRVQDKVRLILYFLVLLPILHPFISTSFYLYSLLPIQWKFWLSRALALLTSTATYSFQFSSVTQSYPNFCDPMNRRTPGLPIHHQLPEITQTHVHQVSDAIQLSHSLSSPSPPAPNPSQPQGLFQLVNSSHEVAKVLEFQLQHQSFQWIPRTDLL